MRKDSQRPSEQYSNFNLKDFFGMNSPKKILIPVAFIAFLCAIGLAFLSFVNPSYDQEAALKMKPIFFGSTRVADDPVNSITLIAPTTTAVYFNILPQKMQFQFDDFVELHGDRSFRDDGAVVGGIGWLGDQAVTVVGIQKGKSLQDNLNRNFGQPSWYVVCTQLLFG